MTEPGQTVSSRLARPLFLSSIPSFSKVLPIPYFLDWLTTAILLSVGGTEANPFLSSKSISDLLILKVLTLPLILFLIYLQGIFSERLSRHTSFFLYIYFSVLTIWNVYLIGEMV